MSDPRPIGVFDSGVGGLSILAAIRRSLPAENILYFADQAHVPYGPRSLEEVASFSLGITHLLLALDAKLIVVACNTASAAALKGLRERLPDVPFVGMEPAVKPAAKVTKSGHIGVLATPATFQGQLFSSLVERFGEGLNIHQATAPGLVERIEAGDLSSRSTREILANAVKPLLADSIDTLVLGCTHYPFIIPLLEEIVGPAVKVIDPAPAVARQTRRLLDSHGLLVAEGAPGSLTFISSDDADHLAALAQRLIGASGSRQRAKWDDDGGLVLTD
jgi:glutamate racemase